MVIVAHCPVNPRRTGTTRNVFIFPTKINNKPAFASCTPLGQRFSWSFVGTDPSNSLGTMTFVHDYIDYHFEPHFCIWTTGINNQICTLNARYFLTIPSPCPSATIIKLESFIQVNQWPIRVLQCQSGTCDQAGETISIRAGAIHACPTQQARCSDLLHVNGNMLAEQTWPSSYSFSVLSIHLFTSKSSGLK